MKSRVAAVVLAAGSSVRFGENKLLRDLDGVPVWRRAVEAFTSHPEVGFVGLVAGPEVLAQANSTEFGLGFCVPGGADRRESAKAGLEATPREFEVVLFHDAARPWVDAELITRVIRGVDEFGAAYPALPVTETIRERSHSRARTLDRDTLLSVQTPQGARRELWDLGHATSIDSATDDIALLEAAGISATAVEGDARNRKITTANDLPRIDVEGTTMETRTGLGYDIHAFSKDPNRPLWLGGVRFEGAGLEGHSDADVLLHAVVDALLGGAGLGDIGELFPNTDEKWRDCASETFVRRAATLANERGWHIIYIDACVIAERPKLMPRRDEIRARIADLAQIEPERVSVKATTQERLGALGRAEGIAAFAVATLARHSPGGTHGSHAPQRRGQS